MLSTVDVVRELGMVPLPVPSGPVRSAARILAWLLGAPFIPPAVQWVEAVGHPAIMDVTKARRDLGWAPRFTALGALRDTIAHRG